MTAVSYRSSPLFVAALALSLAAACSHESSNGTTSPGTSNSVNITIDSGSNLQLAVVGTTIHVSVHAVNANGTIASGETATWTVTAGNGTVSAATTTTSPTGQATVDWTLGTAAGGNNLTVNISGVVTTITATGAPDVLSGLMKVSPDPLTIVSSSSSSIVVRAVDRFGNGIAGVAVTWTATGGLITPAATTTGDDGNATITFTTGPLPATYSITASATGVASKTYTLTGS